MHCVFCGYRIPAATGVCPECGTTQESVRRGRPRTILGTALGILFLRRWTAGAWIRSISTPRPWWSTPLTLALTCGIFLAIIVGGSRYRIEWYSPTAAGAEVYMASVDPAILHAASSLRLAGAVAQEAEQPQGWKVRVVAMEGVAAASVVEWTRAFAISACPLYGWLLWRWLVGPLALRRTRGELDAMERLAAREAVADLAAGIVCAQLVWVVIVLPLALLAGVLAPTLLIEDGIALFMAGPIVWGGAIVLVPLLGWGVALGGDRARTIQPLLLIMVTVVLGVVATPVLSAGAAALLRHILRIVQA